MILGHPRQPQPAAPQLAAPRRACQLELRRSLLLLLLIAGAAIDQVPSCLAIHADENGEPFYDQQPADAATNEEDKRAGGRAFLPAAITGSEKRAGARGFFPAAAAPGKRGGARAFKSQEEQQLPVSVDKREAGPASFYFHPDEKRGGARPFFGSGFFGGGDGTWKRGGGRYFFRSFADNGFGNGWAKRGGGRHFSAKRGGGRSFYGGMNSLFDPSDSLQRYAPIIKFPTQTLALEPAPEADLADEEQQQPIASPFFYTNNHNFEGRANGKRGGGRAFNGEDNNGMMGMDLWEKRGGGRMFSGARVAEML